VAGQPQFALYLDGAVQADQTGRALEQARQQRQAESHAARITDVVRLSVRTRRASLHPARQAGERRRAEHCPTHLPDAVRRHRGLVYGTRKA
jgi:hypothetical protein